jgi:hypothetical protein
MRALSLILAVCGLLLISEAGAANRRATTAAEVIARNVAARGGLESWHKIESMAWLGYIEHGTVNKDSPQSPFVMQMKRPNLTRFELRDQTNHFTRIFDGEYGWRIRPGGNGRPEARLFSPEEVKFAQTEYVVDGPLIDYQVKGVMATLDGVDRIEGREAYRLSLKLPSGAERKVWVDVHSNLEVRLDRPSTSPFGPGKPISVYYRDYQTEGSVKLPHVIETIASPGGSPAETSNRLVVRHVVINPQLEAAAFAPPSLPLRHGSGSLVRIPGSMPGEQAPHR